MLWLAENNNKIPSRVVTLLWYNSFTGIQVDRTVIEIFYYFFNARIYDENILNKTLQSPNPARTAHNNYKNNIPIHPSS